MPVYLTKINFGADGVVEMKGFGADDIAYQNSPSTGTQPTFTTQTAG